MKIPASFQRASEGFYQGALEHGGHTIKDCVGFGVGMVLQSQCPALLDWLDVLIASPPEVVADHGRRCVASTTGRIPISSATSSTRCAISSPSGLPPVAAACRGEGSGEGARPGDGRRVDPGRNIRAMIVSSKDTRTDGIMLHADFTDIETRALRSRLAGDRVILAGLRLLLLLERRANFDPAQPRDGQGRWTDTGWSSTTRIGDPNTVADSVPKDGRTQVAGPFDYGSVDLRSEEGYEGGHTISRHVGKTPEELAARVAWESSRSDRIPRKGWRAGTFSSLAAANDFVERALVANSAIVEAVGIGILPNAPIKFDFGRSTGFEAVLDSKGGPVRFRETNGVHIYIIHDENLLKGFRIHTAYPINLE